jgi:AMP nucleosidase
MKCLPFQIAKEKIMSLNTKEEIIRNWLPRYTGTPLEEFGEYILLVNFSNYVEKFAEINKCPVRGVGGPMQTATSSDGITIVNFGIGSANAATIMDLLGAVTPKACLFLGKCGGLKKTVTTGDFVLPIAALREGSASSHYFPAEVPALPSFKLLSVVAHAISEHGRDYFTGTVYSTNRRVWEHDEKFKEYLNSVRAIGIDMETSTIFIVGFANHIPKGALLLVSDTPMLPEGVKTERSDEAVNQQYLDQHLNIGIDALRQLKLSGESVKHLKF